MYVYILLFSLGFVANMSAEIKQKAVVIYPVIDLSTEPLQTVYKTDKNIEKLYKDIPIAEGKGYFSCARVHQLLFNEVVTITQERGKEVECEVPHIFFETKAKIPIRKFWTLKKNIKKFDQLKKNGYDSSAIPNPYANSSGKLLISSDTLTLSWPWYDPITRKNYSAGTRFKRNSKQDRATHYAIFILDYSNHKKRVSFVPKKHAVVTYSKNPAICCKRFVNLLKKWANQGTHFIPYVTGGCSFIKTYSDDKFYQEKKSSNGKTISFWNRPDKDIPKSGMDCSCLISRAAQICGIPYFFKNTTTLVNQLETLKPKEKLENGDLMWYRGHVLIVSDIKNNKILESTGYPFGYGKVHERPLSEIFKDIKNYRDLINKYYDQKPLKRLNNKGKAAKDIARFKFLKMRSSWKK